VATPLTAGCIGRFDRAAPPTVKMIDRRRDCRDGRPRLGLMQIVTIFMPILVSAPAAPPDQHDRPAAMAGSSPGSAVATPPTTGRTGRFNSAARRAGGRAESHRIVGRFALNPELSFTWYDAALLSQRIRHERRKNTVSQRLRLPLTGDRDHLP
jgi:hypothetical protein